MSLLLSGDLRLAKDFSLDSDAQTYITAVETADGQALETDTRYAINNFVIGCKQDGIWSAIKASCILAGARTRLGALTPLVGTAPTSFNFVDGDYNRKTGLVGDGSTKYLNSSRAGNASAQNNAHASVFVSTADPAGTKMYLGDNVTQGTNIFVSGDVITSRLQTTDAASSLANSSTTGFLGVSRAVAGSYQARFGSTNETATLASLSPTSSNIFIYRRNGGTAFYSNARLAFYSIGESLDLALLDARVTDLINAFGAAIP